MTGWHDRVVAATAAVFVEGGERPRGTGVLIETDKLLTCRHVLIDSGGRLAHGGVTVVLPGLPPVSAYPEQDLPGIDAVVLTLTDPVGVRPVLLSGSSRPPAKAELLGYPQADRTDDGVWRSFTVAGPTASGQVQLDWDDAAGSFKGHSGGPVIDPGTGALVGILRQGATPEGRFDRYLPLARMVEAGVLARVPWLVEGDEAAGHFSRRSRGRYGSGSPTGDLFTGRRAALARVTGWLTAAESGGRVLVVTGQPGAGKSAVVARAGLAAAEALRENGNWRGLLFHARAATAAQFRTYLADLFGSQADSSNHELLEDADRIAEASTGRPDRRWVVLVDALDEASTGTDRTQIAALLREFGRRPWVRAAVGTRPLSATGPYAPGSLLRHFDVTSAADGHLVDLDSPDWFTPADLERLTARLLRAEEQRFTLPGAAWQAYRADDALTGRLAAAITRAAGRNFLVAGMTAPPLAEAAGTLDPAAPGFDPRSLPTSVGSALDTYLARQPDGARLRGILVALAYAEGAGMDDDTWRLAADALGYPVTQADLDTLRTSTVADYLLQTTTEREGHLVRLFHQALVDRLLEGRDHHHAQHRITGALITRARISWADAGTYALMHLATHARRARRLPELLTDVDYLLHADLPTLRAQLGATSAPDAAAHAALVLAAGDHADTAAPARRAAWLALHAAHLGLPDLTHDLGRRSNAALRPIWAHTLGGQRTTLTARHGFLDQALAVVSLPDGRTLLATAGIDRMVRRWDAITGTPYGRPLTGHTESIRAVTAVPTPDGRTLLATAGDDQTVRLWDPATGTPYGRPLTGHGSPIHAVAAVALADGRTLLATAGQTVRLWDPASGTPHGRTLTGHTGSIRAVAAVPLPDGRTLLAGAGDDGTVRLWDPTTGTPHGRPLTGHTDCVNAVAAAPLPDGRTLLASAGDDGTVRLWDPTTGTPHGRPLTGHTGPILGVAAVPLPDGRTLLATAGTDRTVRLWDPATGTPTGPPLTGHTHFIDAVAAVPLPDGRTLLATASRDKTVRLWDPTSGPPTGQPLTGHTEQIRAVAAVPLRDGHLLLATAGKDETIRLWNLSTGSLHGRPLTGHTYWVNAVAAVPMPDGRTLIATAGADQSVRLWDPATGILHGQPLTGHTDWVNAVAAVPMTDGQILLASAGNDETVRLWDPNTGIPHGRPLTGHRHWIRAVAAVPLPDGRTLLASAGDDETVRLWDPTTGTPHGAPLTGHTGPIQAIAAVPLPDGRTLLASAGDDETVRLWDPTTGTPHGRPLTGHTIRISAVAAVPLPDGRTLLASAGHDLTVRFWDPTTGDPAAEPFALGDVCQSLAMIGGRLAIASGAALCLFEINVP